MPYVNNKAQNSLLHPIMVSHFMLGHTVFRTCENGCTTFRLNPVHRIDTSSNTTIGLKNRPDTTFRRKTIRILDEM